MASRPPYAPARIWAVHGLGFLAGLGAMAGVVWLLLADFLNDEVKTGPLVVALLLAVALAAVAWAGVLSRWLGHRWLRLSGLAGLVLVLAACGLLGAILGLDADPAMAALTALVGLFLAGGVALGGMGGQE